MTNLTILTNFLIFLHETVETLETLHLVLFTQPVPFFNLVLFAPHHYSKSDWCEGQLTFGFEREGVRGVQADRERVAR